MSMNCRHCVDDSLLIEIVVSPNIRIGISLEPNIEESSWYLVAKQGALSDDILIEGDMIPEAAIMQIHRWLDGHQFRT